ncbi:DUF4190 domain-containing protein [Kitasatospora sp. NPDC088391]|uniref:DUF4190 domain-containing protein n=1 Tax=Kitasatospora sp. NPDC088391 TaxID=3364074 RepID=UPI00381D9D79
MTSDQPQHPADTESALPAYPRPSPAPGDEGPALLGPPRSASAETDGPAVAAMVLGLLCCLGPVGIVLGTVALARIARTGRRGKGMAITGIVAGTLWSVAVVAGALLSPVDDPPPRPTGPAPTGPSQAVPAPTGPAPVAVRHP